mmetsp:Transcript_13879/g.22654  ORF Transcript_13879/g.22654 Transcript_13879/m.22654 type:complete len:274 (-) Transcript_13879:868-1689(-)
MGINKGEMGHFPQLLKNQNKVKKGSRQDAADMSPQPELDFMSPLLKPHSVLHQESNPSCSRRCSVQTEQSESSIDTNTEDELEIVDVENVKKDVVLHPMEVARNLQTNEIKSLNRLGAALWNMACAGGDTRNKKQVLDGKSQPKLKLDVYIKRIVRAMNDYDDEVSCYNIHRQKHTLGFRLVVSAMVFIDRILNENSDRLVLKTINVHRLVVTCMLVASKFCEDEPLNNEFWARVGGLPLKDLNACEVEVCNLLNYNLRVSEESYVKVVQIFE